MSATRSRAWQLLEAVPDPELPALSVTDLGIVRDVVEADEGRRVVVTITSTYSGCPATEVIAADVRTTLAAAYDEVEIRMQLSPAWSSDWLSEVGRAKLRATGIAPPNGRATLPMAGNDAPDTCPHCGSANVEQLAGFGATPCRALWRCRECREPFDYFKAH